MVGLPNAPPANGSRLEARLLLCAGIRANANWDPLSWLRFFGAQRIAFSIGSKPGGGFLYHQWTLGESSLRAGLVSPSGFLGLLLVPKKNAEISPNLIHHASPIGVRSSNQ
jgi:hypothetical protein